MTALHEQLQNWPSGSSVAELARLLDVRKWSDAPAARSRKLIESLQALVQAGPFVWTNGAIELPRARLLAWIRPQDISEPGHPSWRAFPREELAASASWGKTRCTSPAAASIWSSMRSQKA